LAAALAYDEDAIVVVQDEQLGTAQAVQQAKDSLAGFSGDVIVLYGDTPFIQPETLDAMLSAGITADVVVLSLQPPIRVVRSFDHGW
jgi:bifunctional UDP-N-acetylglucosamine pyrophosphorylase/glucosamine-1-phosphate N-acetyltransferase